MALFALMALFLIIGLFIESFTPGVRILLAVLIVCALLYLYLT